MNHDDDDLDPRDALASAHLDGLTTAEEAARIAADADLRARVAALEAVRAALRAPVPTDEAARERAISAALAAAAVEPAGATVTDLSAVAARRATPSRVLRIVGVAAALVLLALAVPLLAQMGGDSADDETASVADAPEGPDQATEERAEADDGAAAGGGAPSTQAQVGADAYSAGDESAAEGGLAEVGSLGRFDDADALAARVAELLGDEGLSGPRPATSSSPERASTGGACAGEAEGASEAGASVILVGSAVLEGREVRVTVVERADGRRTLTAADGAASCAAVLTTDLDG
jgi:hypothetical protein